MKACIKQRYAGTLARKARNLALFREHLFYRTILCCCNYSFNRKEKYLLLLKKAERKVIRVVYNGQVYCKSQIRRQVSDYKKISVFFFNTYKHVKSKRNNKRNRETRRTKIEKIKELENLEIEKLKELKNLKRIAT